MANNDFNCQKCDLKDTERMVQCDTCDKWYHYECVGVNSDVANVSWSCSCGESQHVQLRNKPPANSMASLNGTAAFSANLQVLSSPSIAKGAIPSDKEQQSRSNASVNNLSAHKQLQLQMLDEENELQKQYLAKKYEILSQGDSSQEARNNMVLSFQPTASQISARQVIPKDLPNFDGNPEDWPLFISNFKNSTQIAGYTDGENLMRLQSCLRGRAKELVKSKLLIPSMVPEIIQTLEMCFGRPEHILDNMIDKVTRLPPLKDKLDSLIEYALTVRNVCSTMESCSMIAHMNNPMLVKTLVEKLPNNQKLNWAMHPKDEKVPIVKSFSDWIYNLAAAASQVVFPLSTKKGAPVNTHHQDSKEKRNCYLCHSNEHKIQHCGEFQSMRLDEKWNFIKENKLCRQCLNSHRRNCFSKKICGITNCTAKHHPLLHNYSLVRTSAGNAAFTENSGSVNAHNDTNKEKPCFRILPVRIYCKNKLIDTFAFLDEGSSVTLMEKSLFDSLGLVGKKEPLELRWTGDTTRLEEESFKVDLEISNVKSESRYVIHDVHTVNNLGLPMQSLNFDDIVRDNPYLKGLPIQSYMNAKPMVLIGVNNWRVAVPLKIREGERNQPIATKTRLGWTLQGACTDVISSASLNIHTCECEKRYNALHDEVKEFFSLESPPEKVILSSKDQQAIEILENTVVKTGQQFEVGLLWKDKNTPLPESYDVAYHRLKCLLNKFKKQPTLRQTMQNEIDKLICKGYAKELSANEIAMNRERTWYLPIFLALNPNKPGKIRLVWDAASKSKNKSLNDFLLSGPDLLASLFNILIEFRVGKIAICGDIAEMFHRININDEDMHAQRFLWFANGDCTQQPVVYVMKALSFGLNCAPCIAHFVRNKNASEFRSSHPRAVKAMESYHYMDDFIDSVDSEEEALNLALQVKAIHSAAGFHMRNWASNSKLVRQHLCEDDSATQTSFGAFEKVLGMYWESNNDVFQYNSRFSRLRRNVLLPSIVPTKREVLQVLMSIFDPLGLVSHRTIGLKILLQDVWRSGIKWDDELRGDLKQKWVSWLENLPKISSILIPRCYSPLLTNTSNIQLHTFVDAGENAYAAVCYLRVQHGDNIDISMVAAKSKVSPLKPSSIPRLELQAALIGTRLASKIIKATRLTFAEITYWTDSKTVLKWLNMDPKNFKAFVMYRVGEILEASNISQWRWVPSKSNPADLATKISSVDDDIWFNGPTLLKNGEHAWPKCLDLGSANTEEVRNRFLHIDKSYKFSMNVEYFSCWRRLYKALAQFILYLKKLQSIVGKYNLHENTNLKCIQESKNILFKYAQHSEFFDEFWSLKTGKEIHKDSKLKQLNIVLDDNEIIRACGRAEMLSCNNAIILPQKHHVTFLIIKYYHENYHHCLHEAVMCKIKSNFYIPKLRAEYKIMRSKCQRCKNQSAIPHTPQMAVLPSARLAVFQRPFTYVGIDFFGPIYTSVGRRKEKRWGVLFTCLTVRAVHVEVAHSLDTSSCIMSIQNFISRRGCPKEIYTDNGTNFKSTEKILREEKENINFNEVFSKHDEIKWRFNPPAAPHMGGAWERLVRSVKTILYAMCPAFKFNDETLRSALWEVEFIINSRPLTFVTLDSADDDALTPNHLLLGSAAGNKPLCELDNDLRQRWHQTQKFANHFWRRWVREYGPNLVRRSKWFKKVEPPAVGDIVVVVDDTLPRNSWPKGVIIETTPAKDGQVRRVKVKTNISTLERPVAKIAVLDVANKTNGKRINP